MKKMITIYHLQSTRSWEKGEIKQDTYDVSTLADPGCILIGTEEVEVNQPDPIDTTIAEIDALEKAVQKERAESQVKVNLLLERISNLKAIGCDGDAQ